MASEKVYSNLQAIVTAMLQSVEQTDFAKDPAGDKVIREIHNMLQQFGVDFADVVAPEILQAYFGGVDEATALMQEMGVGPIAAGPVAEVAVGTGAAAATLPISEAGMALTKEGLISQPFQKLIHIKAVQEIIDDTMMDMSAAINTAKLSSSTAIKETLAAVNDELAQGLILGNAQQTTTTRVMDAFRERGMTSFVTADGKNLPLDFYAMTVNRTKTRTATVQGSINRYKDVGASRLVRIVGNGDSCEECSRFNMLVVCIEGTHPDFPAVTDDYVKLPPFHPNCRCGIRPFVQKFQDDDAFEEAVARAAEFKADPLKDRRTPAEKAAYEQEQALRREARRELKQYQRWQALLGADAPKTIGAFKTMKRKNTPKFQELQSLVRSAAQTSGGLSKVKVLQMRNVKGTGLPLPKTVQYKTPSVTQAAALKKQKAAAEAMADKPEMKAYLEAKAAADLAEAKAQKLAAQPVVNYTKEEALAKYPLPKKGKVDPLQAADPVAYAQKMDVQEAANAASAAKIKAGVAEKELAKLQNKPAGSTAKKAQKVEEKQAAVAAAVEKKAAAKPKKPAKAKAPEYTKEEALAKYPLPTDKPVPFEQLMDPVKWAKKQDKLAAKAAKAAPLAAAKQAKVVEAVTAKKVTAPVVSGSLKKAALPATPGKVTKLASNKKELFETFQKGAKMETEVLQAMQTKKIAGDVHGKISEYSSIRQDWMDSSVGGRARGLQNYVNTKFGLGMEMLDTKIFQGTGTYDIADEMDDILEAQMEHFQSKLRAKGYSHVRVYRGVSFPKGTKDLPDWFPEDFSEKSTATYNDGPKARPLTSWSFSESAANQFANGQNRGVVMYADIPVEQVFSAFGLGDEAELVPIGAIKDVRLKNISDAAQQLLDKKARERRIKASYK